MPAVAETPPAAAASGRQAAAYGRAVGLQSDLVVDLQAHFAGTVDAGSIEQGIGFSTGKAAQQNGLSVLLGVT